MLPLRYLSRVNYLSRSNFILQHSCSFNKKSFGSLNISLSNGLISENKNYIRYYSTINKSNEEIIDVEHKFEREKVPMVSKLIGVSSLIPMAATTYGAFFLSASQASLSIYYQMTYGVVLMSFMGAVHWGLAMAGYSSISHIFAKEDNKSNNQSVDLLKPTNSQQIGRYCMSVLPCIYGWGLHVLPLETAVPALLVGFVAQLVADVYADSKGLVPTWYIKFKIPLTMGILLSLGISYLVIGTNRN